MPVAGNNTIKAIRLAIDEEEIEEVDRCTAWFIIFLYLYIVGVV